MRASEAFPDLLPYVLPSTALENTPINENESRTTSLLPSHSLELQPPDIRMSICWVTTVDLNFPICMMGIMIPIFQDWS